MNIEKLLNAPKVEVSVLDTSSVDKEFVKAFRKKHNLTQVALANIMGVKKKTIEKWEQGTNKVSGSSAVLLSLFDSDESILEKVYCVNMIEEKKVVEKCEIKSQMQYNVKCNNLVEQNTYSGLAADAKLCFNGGIY